MIDPNPPITDNLIGVRLLDIYPYPDHEKILFGLLAERSMEDDPYVNISHRKMPTWTEHCKFIASKPYRKWFFIEGISWDADKKIHLEPGSINYATAVIGTCYLTRLNEIGIILFGQYRGRGFGTKAVHELTRKFKPLKAIPGKRRGRFLANINPKNEKSIRLFTNIGFTHDSNTYIL